MKTKECFKSSEIAHVWAHQKHATGRVSGGNERFSGTQYFSYSTVIANIIKYKGKQAFVVDTAGFSITTSSHQGGVRAAIRNLGQVFYVNCGRRGQSLDFTPETLRDHYLNDYRDPVKVSKHKASNYRAQLASVRKLDEAIEVCAFFGLAKAKLVKERAKLQPAVDEASKFLAEYEAKLKARADIKWANRSAADKAREAARIARQIERAEGDVTKLEKLDFGFGWRDDSASNWGPNQCDLESRPDLQQKIRDEDARRAALTVDDWLAGVPYAPRPDGPCVLRVSDGDVETSLGARVPLDHAKRAFEFILNHRDGWKKNGHTFHIGHYELDEITGDEVHAGCHVIKISECERFAKTQGWVS